MKPAARRALCLLALAAAAGCASAPEPLPERRTPPPAPAPAPAGPALWHEEGVASYYGPGFHGKETTSGEVFDTERDLTAAHQRLPFGTMVRVTRLDNGKSVVVRVNDRGPFAKGRVIDLSMRAAREIDMIGPGTARVRVESLHPVDPRGMKRTDTWTVQAAAFQDPAAARRLKARLEDRYGQVNIERSEEGFYRVRVGAFDSRREAEALAEELEEDGLRPRPVPVFP